MADLDMDRVERAIDTAESSEDFYSRAESAVAEVGRQLAEKLDARAREAEAVIEDYDDARDNSAALMQSAFWVREWTGAPTNEGERR